MGLNCPSCLLPEGKRDLSRGEEDKAVKGRNYSREQVSKCLTKKYR